jgi:hypothetical protein
MPAQIEVADFRRSDDTRYNRDHDSTCPIQLHIIQSRDGFLDFANLDDSVDQEGRIEDA